MADSYLMGQSGGVSTSYIDITKDVVKTASKTFTINTPANSLQIGRYILYVVLNGQNMFTGVSCVVNIWDNNGVNMWGTSGTITSFVYTPGGNTTNEWTPSLSNNVLSYNAGIYDRDFNNIIAAYLFLATFN